jgi:hypothetical protein
MLRQFKWIVINCGVNMAIPPNGKRYQYERRDREWEELRKFLAKEANHRPEGTILMSCAFDHPSVPATRGVLNTVFERRKSNA